MEERGLIGLEARAADGTEIGRIAEVVADEESGEVTHVIVETESGDGWRPDHGLSLDPEADFASFEADPSDEEPGDHTGDEVEPQATASRMRGGLRTRGPVRHRAEDQDEAHRRRIWRRREDWEDETYTADSGYPRNDVYVDPDTGEEEVDPLLKENEDLTDDVADLLDGTNLVVGTTKDGVVALTGAMATQEDLEDVVREIMGLDEVLEVDTTDVDVG